MPTSIAYADVCCALGASLDESVSNLLAGKQQLSHKRFDLLQDPLGIPYYLMPEQAPGAIDAVYAQLHNMVDGAIKTLNLTAEARARTGLFLGSSSFDVNVSEHRYQDQLRQGQSALPIPIIGYGKIAIRLQRLFGLGPYCYTYSTACTSSANALLNAHRLLKAGLIDHAIVVGIELFNQTTALGFHGLGLISPKARMAPFEAQRDGLLLGEGCGLLVLTGKAESGVELCGGAIATDNHSLTAANSDGSSIAAVIEAALRDGGCSAPELRAIKVHGTASLMNDEAEAAGLRRLYPQHPPLFALKPFIGHTLGACGALETALTFACLQRGRLPGNAVETADENLGVRLCQEQQPAATGLYGLNFFAFGGNNTCLLLRKTSS